MIDTITKDPSSILIQLHSFLLAIHETFQLRPYRRDQPTYNAHIISATKIPKNSLTSSPSILIVHPNISQLHLHFSTISIQPSLSLIHPVRQKLIKIIPKLGTGLSDPPLQIFNSALPVLSDEFVIFPAFVVVACSAETGDFADSIRVSSDGRVVQGDGGGGVGAGEYEWGRGSHGCFFQMYVLRVGFESLLSLFVFLFLCCLRWLQG